MLRPRYRTDEPQLVRYSERPELWDGVAELTADVWPEYNQHGEVPNRFWPRLYTDFPEWQFLLWEPGDGTVLAERHTIPVAWDGTDDGLRDAGLTHLIAPVRPSQKDRYPTIPIQRYAQWTRADGTPFDPWIRVHTRLGAARPGHRALPPHHRHVEQWESWTGMRFPETGEYVFPAAVTCASRPKTHRRRSTSMRRGCMRGGSHRGFAGIARCARSSRT
jgi:hypothetical protein